jgi:hypothetical protein
MVAARREWRMYQYKIACAIGQLEAAEDPHQTGTLAHRGGPARL